MFRLIYTCVLSVLVFSINIDAARILAMIPTPSISHQVVLRPLTQELVRRGHQVTIITTDPAFPKGKTPQNLTEIDVHDLSYREWKKILGDINNGEKSDVAKQIQYFADTTLRVFEKQMNVPEVQDIIKNKKNTFDLFLVEAWPRFALGLAHKLKIPAVIGVSSMGVFSDICEVMGSSMHPLMYPDPFTTRIYNHTFWEKISHFYTAFSLKYAHIKRESVEYEVVKRIFGEDTPPLSELLNNVDMLFVNLHTIWEGNRPVPPSVIHIGGVHQNPRKELPQDLKKYLDSSKHGVIYISFGTNVDTSMLPIEKIQEIIKALSQLPYEVLWKWNADELPGRTENIKISKWFPQSDLLRHPKVKLFITQGGLQSTDECITAGVPLIGIPMLADQWYNVEKYVHHRIGKHIELASLDAVSLKDAIKTVIEDSSYHENIVRLRTLLNDQPMTALERAVWWTEHVLRHRGAKHLRAPAANMPWSQYYEIPLVLTILSIVVAAIVLISIAINKIVNLATRQFTSSSKVKRS